MLFQLYKSFVITAMVMLVAYAASAQSNHAVEKSVVFEAGKPVYTLAVGELTEQAGFEIVIQDASGHVRLIDPTSGSHEVISNVNDPFNGMSNRPTLEIGEVDNRNDGLEVVASSNTFVVSLSLTNEGWQREIIFDRSELVGVMWGARVGEFMPFTGVEEVFVIFEPVFDQSNGYVYQRTDQGWEEFQYYQAEVGMDSAIGEFYSDNPGPEVIVTTEMGPTYQFHPSEEVADPVQNWNLVWDNFDDAGWVAKVGDVYPEIDGNEIVYGTRYNNKIMISYPNPFTDFLTHEVIEVFQGQWQGHPPNMWDVAVGDVLADIPGDEIIGVDEGGYVYMVWYENGGWQSQVLDQHQRTPLYAARIADVDLSHPGNEVLVAGQNGQITQYAVQDSTAVRSWNLFN